jgi:hypothetical protein
VALAQDFFHDLRNRHVLVNGVLVRAVEQRQAWLERQGVAGFIFDVLRRSKPVTTP